VPNLVFLQQFKNQMAASRRKPSSKKSSRSKGLPVTAVAVIRLAIMLGFLSVSRVLFWLFNLHYFSDLAGDELFRLFLRGILFDVSALLTINLPFILLVFIPFRFRGSKFYTLGTNILFYAVNIVALMVNLIDAVYFRFTLKRLTADIFRYLGVGGDFNALVPQFLKDFWPVMAVWIILSVLLVWICTRIKSDPSPGKPKDSSTRYYVVHGLVFLVAVAVAMIGIRGGFGKEPIGFRTAARYAPAKAMPLLINTPFSLAVSFNDDPVRQEKYFRTEKELAAVYTPFHPGTPDTLRPLNVMILIMESFSREHIGALNRDLANGTYEGYTPFLDSLIGESMSFTAFANGKTSIQGVPSILSGIPTLMDRPMVQSPYAGDKMTGIAGLLKPYGYTTAFFHGGTNGIMSYDTYMPKIGFDHYYGRTEYGNDKDYDGKWGIRDEEFLRFMAGKVNAMAQPFVVAFFSLSSHHPYEVPGKYRHQFRKGSLPIQQTVRYADHSLAQFFYAVRHENWFFNTLFVITADHTSEGYYPYYNSHNGQYAVPMIFYKPGSKLKGVNGRIAQQTDVVPSVLGYLGYDRSFIAFGNNLFDDRQENFSIQYLSGVYTLIRGGYSLEYDGEHTTAFFNLDKDPLQQNNIAGKGNPVQAKQEIFLKAYLQQYNNRMIENRLMVE
jgi:phosphoglycerol transferase MdoB-like AlkP superfamily enzyme